MSDSPDTPTPSSLPDDLAKRSRDVWLAGLGALATVEEEGSKLFSRLVEQGKTYQEARKKQVEEATETAEEAGEYTLSRLEEVGEETRTFLVDSMQRALGRLEVPTRSEVDSLSEQVETLSAKVDALTQSLADEDDDA
jgi:poly(hydroxyalkanoate) granule-associated protein